ncbi:MAG: signal peptidase I [Candidatus Cloacimonetes bacterium]|nr:signal peptidase I [Candidatus Cloacimonadota bacterium]
MIITMWKIFVKAGKPGWACLIPDHSIVLIFDIVGRPGWWWFLLLIPIVNIIILIIVIFDFAKAFGKGVGFGFGLLLLGIIFYPILAFGSAEYIGGKE